MLQLLEAVLYSILIKGELLLDWNGEDDLEVM